MTHTDDRFLAGFRACREAAAQIVEEYFAVAHSATCAAKIRALPDPAPAAEPEARVAEIRALLEARNDALAAMNSPRDAMAACIDLDAPRKFSKRAPEYVNYLLSLLEDRR